MRREFLLLRPIYHLLYHQFAWSYDRVADLASLRPARRDLLRDQHVHLEYDVLRQHARLDSNQ